MNKERIDRRIIRRRGLPDQSFSIEVPKGKGGKAEKGKAKPRTRPAKRR